MGQESEKYMCVCVYPHTHTHTGLPGDSVGKESACNAGDLGLNPGLEKSPGEGNGYPFQYSCLENSMDRGSWWATIHGLQRIIYD